MYFCKENPTPTNVDNLDFMLSAMEAVGRTHSITRSFLRQALLDIEWNGVQDIVRLPRVTRLSQRLNTGVSHNVPLLARTRLSRHSEAQPPIPNLPAGRAMPRRPPPSASASWAQPTRNSGPSSIGDSSSSGPNGHSRKRQRTATPSSNSSLHPGSAATSGTSLPFCYIPIRSELSPTPNHHNTETPNPNMNQGTDPSKSKQNTLNNDQNRVGVTIASGILGKSGPKPFATASRETSQTKISKGGMGSWELGGLVSNSWSRFLPVSATFGSKNLPLEQ